MDFLLPVLILILVVFLVRQQRNARQQALINRENGLKFLAENASNEGVITTASGLQYQVLTVGNGNQHPSPTSKVKVHYHGTLVDGRVFDSSVERGEPLEFRLDQVIKGWTEGLQLMVEGEKARLVIPSELAYGNGAAGIITPGSTLIFEVELLTIS